MFRPKDTATEPHVVVNPRDPRNILAVWIQDFGVSHTVAASHDGGRTWRRADPPGLGQCTGGRHGAPADPTAAFAPDGTVYLVSMSADVRPGDTGPTNSVLVNRSGDGGLTWSHPTEVVPANAYNDHPGIAVDPHDPRRVYVSWARRSGPFGANTESLSVAISSDGGQTWPQRRVIYTPPRVFLVDTGSALTAKPDGTLLCSFGEVEAEGELPGFPATPRRMLVMRSTDRGLTWSAPTTIGSSPRVSVADPADGHRVTAENSPSVAAGPDGTAYAVWANRTASGPSEVVISKTNDGLRWSAPAGVASPRAPAFLPTVAVAGDGAIGVHWYDLRNDKPGDGQLTTDVWMSHSQDDGSTWKETHLAGPFDMRTAWDDPRSFPRPTFFVGDYMGHAGTPEGFAAAIVQARPRAQIGKSQVFVARLRLARRLRVQVRPRRVRAGSLRRFRVRVGIQGSDGYLPLREATVRLGVRTARTDASGHARLRLRLRSPGLARVRTRSLEGGAGQARVRVLPARR